jgi:amicyanin
MQRFRLLRFYVVGLVALIGLAVWGVSLRRATSDAPGGQDTKRSPVQVSIEHSVFEPKELVVPVGTTVTWVNADDVPHTATSTAAPPLFDSKTLRTGSTFSFEFKAAGTYEYFCKAHPYMTGKVVVK